jgi:hypothetical protein
LLRAKGMMRIRAKLLRIAIEISVSQSFIGACESSFRALVRVASTALRGRSSSFNESHRCACE